MQILCFMCATVTGLNYAIRIAEDTADFLSCENCIAVTSQTFGIPDPVSDLEESRHFS